MEFEIESGGGLWPRMATLEGLCGGPLYFYDEDEEERVSLTEPISVSNALRLHSGHIRVKAVISSVRPLCKMTRSTTITCKNCSNSENVHYEKPEFVARKIQVTKCYNCNDSSISITNEYVNSVTVELQDPETFSDIDRLPVYCLKMIPTILE